MAYLVPADFRDGSFNPACTGLLLSDDEANDVRLTAGIAAASQRIDSITFDHFEKQDEATVELDVYRYSSRLYLPRRTTSITTLKTRDHTGTLTLQAAANYRLRSSLDTAGAVRLHWNDFIEILPLGSGISGPDIYEPWVWPYGAQAVQIVGDFGWTVTPGDIKRACALLVWDTFKREAGDIRRASRWARGDLTVERATDTKTGIPEADELLAEYIRESM